MSQPPILGLVDDDPCMLKALRRLLLAEGFVVRAFTSPRAFLESLPGLEPDCAILDVSMPGISGLELQQQLHELGFTLPVIFLTGRGDIPMTVRAMQSGAVNFLTKPVNDSDLLAAIAQALAITMRQRTEEKALASDRRRLATLTPREVEVLQHVIAGKLNKQIAADLGTAEQTIKVHRMRITEKLGCPSVAELVRLAERLGVSVAN